MALTPEQRILADKLIEEIKRFTVGNRISDDVKLDAETKDFLNSILQGVPEFAPIFGKPQHSLSLIHIFRIKASLAHLEINGPNTLLAVTPEKELLCVCDSKKLRPVVIGRNQDTVIMTSEVVGINDLMPDRNIEDDIYPNEHETIVVRDDLTVERWQQ